MTAIDPDAALRLVRRLALQPHPEGGWYRETWRDRPADGSRGAVTHIHYLLQAGERSHWHRIDAVEIWHFAAGGPLRLRIATPGVAPEEVVLGADPEAGQETHAIVAAGAWQTAEPLAAWTLVGCTVAPAFRFEGFELAPPGWEPDRG